MSAAVLCNGSETEPFKVETGVKQGCIIAPNLFTIFVAAILQLIGNNLHTRVQFDFGTEGKLFNLNRFKSKSKLSHSSIMALQYADDNDIVAHTEDLQITLNAFARAYKMFLGLTLNIKKTLLHQPPPDTFTGRTLHYTDPPGETA